MSDNEILTVNYKRKALLKAYNIKKHQNIEANRHHNRYLLIRARVYLCFC